VQGQNSRLISINEVGTGVDYGRYICQNYLVIDFNVIDLQLPENLKLKSKYASITNYRLVLALTGFVTGV
jgi:hypothetical protein